MSEVKNNIVHAGLCTEEGSLLKRLAPLCLAQNGGDIFLNLIAY
jgi:hypothetical protein